MDQTKFLRDLKDLGQIRHFSDLKEFIRTHQDFIKKFVLPFFVLLLMSIANILSNGMDQYLVFKNATNADSIRVLDLYVYELGIGKGSIPLTTVMSMLKSVISVTLLFAANHVSKAIRGESIV